MRRPANGPKQKIGFNRLALVGFDYQAAVILLGDGFEATVEANIDALMAANVHEAVDNFVVITA